MEVCNFTRKFLVFSRHTLFRHLETMETGLDIAFPSVSTSQRVLSLGAQKARVMAKYSLSSLYSIVKPAIGSRAHKQNRPQAHESVSAQYPRSTLSQGGYYEEYRYSFFRAPPRTCTRLACAPVLLFTPI